MKCPHCEVAGNFKSEGSLIWTAKPVENNMKYQVAYGHCPECERLIIVLNRKPATDINIMHKMSDASSLSVNLFWNENFVLLYPKRIARHLESEIQEPYRTEFLEAVAVLPASPKASAALSRRILQNILREKFGIKRRNLVNEIEEFIAQKDTPTYMAEQVDAIRHIGNFAAHPSKDTNTGEIVDVEPGEAEWLLDVLESLFDYAFVKRSRLDERKKRLNEKLQNAGKPPMK